MVSENIRNAFICAAQKLTDNEKEFGELDAKTGDGDHGVTMSKVGRAIIRAVEAARETALPEFFYLMFDEIVSVNGGSIAPLWALMADGAAQALKVSGVEPVKAALKGAYEGIRTVSSAKEGEKTLVDPLCAAIKAVEMGTESGAKALLSAAAEAAQAAAEATRDMPAKYGRAKNLSGKGVGFLDPGAVSFARFIRGLADNLKEVA